MKNIKYKIVVLIIFFNGLYNNTYSQVLNIYQLSEKNITVNEFNILEELDEEDIDFEIGNPDSIKKEGLETINEFGYDIIRYCYGSSIIVARGLFIGDIFINDTRLSINGIKVGDYIGKVKNEFLKYNIKNYEVVIYHGDNSLTFYFDSNNKITKIIYSVPL